MNEYEWLKPFAGVPENAALPLYMSPVPDDAVGSYGAQAIEWIEGVEKKTLRWWQRLAITRQLEHREDGSLCHRFVLESTPRRAGKSVRLRGVALWRLAHPEIFGSPEPQTVIHTGSDMQICQEIQRGAWRWAQEDAGWKVGTANGKEKIETKTGDRWLIRSQDKVYGYSPDFGIVDEGWDVKPDTVSEGLEPATLERMSPQIHITSTAHRRATSMMKSRLLVALTTEDKGTLLLLWAAAPEMEPGDPATWRAASPHWSEDRHRMIADKYEKAQAGEVDPQADDPDPMEGFKAQYLNIWQLNKVTTAKGTPLATAEEWEARKAVIPAGSPYAAAIEDNFGGGVTLALAWRAGDRAVVSTQDHPDLTSVAQALKASGFRGTATVGASLTEDPAFHGTKVAKGTGRVGAVVQDLRLLLNEDALYHDGGDHLTGQVLAARTLPGADGPRMASNGRADAIKAAVWAAQDCRRKEQARGQLRVITV